MKIRLGAGWNADALEDTEVIVQMIAEAFEAVVEVDTELEVIVSTAPERANPYALYARQGAAFEVQLTSDPSGLYWAQMTLQLAHELCHVYSNFSLSRGHKHKWLEESLCEAASIATLNKLGTEWHSSALSARAPNYGSSLLEYVNTRRASARQIRFKSDFKLWLKANLSQLERCSTQRELNNVVANYLYNKILSPEPSTWKAIRFLNTWDCHSNETFQDFGESWVGATVDQLQPATRRLLELLGVDVP